MFKNFVTKKKSCRIRNLIEYKERSSTTCQQFRSPVDPQHLSVGFYVKSACKDAMSRRKPAECLAWEILSLGKKKKLISACVHV